MVRCFRRLDGECRRGSPKKKGQRMLAGVAEKKMRASADRKKAVPLDLMSPTTDQTAVPLVFGLVRKGDLPASRYLY